MTQCKRECSFCCFVFNIRSQLLPFFWENKMCIFHLYFPAKLWNTWAGKNICLKHYTMKWNLWPLSSYLTVWKSPKDSDFLLTSNSFDQTSVRIFCFSFTDFRPPFFDSEARFTRDCATSQTKIGSSANTSEKSWNGQRFRSSVGKDSKNFIVWGTSQNKSEKTWPRMLTTRWIHQN